MSDCNDSLSGILSNMLQGIFMLKREEKAVEILIALVDGAKEAEKKKLVPEGTAQVVQEIVGSAMDKNENNKIREAHEAEVRRRERKRCGPCDGSL